MTVKIENTFAQTAHAVGQNKYGRTVVLNECQLTVILVEVDCRDLIQNKRTGM